MAKFGNFVGKKDLELTNEEKEMFMNFFKMKLFNYNNCNDLYRTLYGLY